MFLCCAVMSQVEIRLVATWEECLACEDLQQEIWAMPDYREVVPANLLMTALKNGGILIGAFDGARMIGFAFGFLGSEVARENGEPAGARLKHTSHMLGVLSDARAHGLGAQMKWFQRAIAMEQGLELMTWTYDPLQATNAHLNFARLGAFARRYIVNAYGEMTDALNVGVASDRFEVEWYLKSARVRERATTRREFVKPAFAEFVYRIEWDENNLPRIADERALEGESLLVEIPNDYNAMKALDHALAMQWRERTRGTFERAFALGYVACEVLRERDAMGRARFWYVLQRSVS